MRSRVLVAVVTASLFGCGEQPVTGDDAGSDAGAVIVNDAGHDAGGVDAGSDAGGSDAGIPDAGNDAGFDAGIPEVDAGYQGPTNPFPADGGYRVVRVTPTMNFSFIEGPLWRPAEGVLIFSDIPANKIWQWSPAQGFSVFRDPSNSSNGIAREPNGGLLAAEHGGRRVARLLADGGTQSVADRYDGGRLNSPNDVIVRSDGTVFFTDPPYGVQANQRELAFQGVFRVDAAGVLHVVADDMSSPNGIALSPDERVLYIADTTASLVRRYDVNGDGTVSGRATFTQTGGGGDGMAVDLAGNLYVTTNAGVKVYAPDARLLGTIVVPQEPANCGFGGADFKTLFITARTGLYSVELQVPGIP